MIELQLLCCGAVLCPILLLLVVFALPLRAGLSLYLSSIQIFLRSRFRGASIAQRFRRLLDLGRAEAEVGLSLLSPPSSRIILGLALVVAAELAIYTYTPGVNPDERCLGVDIPRYAADLQRMIELPPLEAVSYAFYGAHSDRPFSLLFHYIVQRATGLPPGLVVRYVHVLLSPLLVLSVYFFAREALRSDGVASAASLLTAVSYPATVGMYGGFLANWLALPLLYLSLTFTLRAMEKGSNISLGLSLLASVSLLFTHPYTWGVLLGSLLFYLTWSAARSWRGVRVGGGEWIAVAVVLAVNVAVDIVKLLLGLGSGIGAESSVAASGLGIDNLLSFWPNIFFTFRYYLGGLFTNPVSWVLAVVGVYHLTGRSRMEAFPSRLLLSWVSVAAVPMLMGDFVVQSRLLYDLPIDLLSAVGICTIFGVMRGSAARGRGRWILACLFAALVTLVYINYGFRFSTKILLERSMG